MLKETLREVDQNDLFAEQPRHRRQAEQSEEEEERGWKNRNKKKSKDKKGKNKKKKAAAGKTKFEQLLDSIDGPEFLSQPDQDSIDKADKASEEPEEEKDKEEEDNTEEAVEELEEDEDDEEEEEEQQQFTNGLQFSAYSQQPAPTYNLPTEDHQLTSDESLLFGVDMEGEPQYMRQEALNVLLANPHAKKVLLCSRFKRQSYYFLGLKLQ